MSTSIKRVGWVCDNLVDAVKPYVNDELIVPTGESSLYALVWMSVLVAVLYGYRHFNEWDQYVNMHSPMR